MCWWWNDLDDDLRENTEVWRMLHPLDFNPMDLEDPWGYVARDENRWEDDESTWDEDGY